MKDKKLLYKISLFFILILTLLGACGKKTEEEKKKVEVSEEKKENTAFSIKETKYKEDNTTEVLVDKTFKKEDIKKSVKHGDHWHVWTKNGVEHITYTDPDEMQEDTDIQLVDVISLDKLKGKNVKDIKLHGDHWHVYTDDGREFLTYEDPSKVFSNVAIGEYTGSHGNNVNKSNSSKKLSNNDVVKILVHGDHYHIYTRDGSEFISYEDPRSKYPNAEFGIYRGSHGDTVAVNTSTVIQDNSRPINTGKTKPILNKNNLDREISKLNIIRILGQKEVDRYDIVKVLKHGDHYHLYDSKGNEGLVYVNPSQLYPNAIFGQYVGNHGDNKKDEKVKVNDSKPVAKDTKKENKPNSDKADSNNDVVKILVHGDHYHIYTRDGAEYISYEDPRSKYPNAQFGIYKGSHGDQVVDNSEKEKPQAEKNNPAPIVEKPKTEKAKPAPTIEKPIIEKKNPNEQKNSWKQKVEKLNIIRVLGKDELDRFDVVKILKHGDHYHLYDSKGNEGILYENPRDLYPKAVFGEYKGSHGDNKIDNKPDSEKEKKNPKDEDKWPKGVDRIVEHGDHYHIYIGDKEVGLVFEDPRPHYPNAVFEEDITKKGEKIGVNDSEMFSYDSIEAKLYMDVLPYLPSHIKNVTHYGDLYTDLAIAGSDGDSKDIFYWNHGNHYHAITIKQLIQLEKIGRFGGHTAKEVASSLKYAIVNNTTLEKIDAQKTVNPTVRQMADFIKAHYKLEEKDLSIGENFVEIPLGGDYAYFETIQFIIKNGKIVPRVTMPTAESIAKELEEMYGADEDDYSEEFEDSEEDEIEDEDDDLEEDGDI